MQEKKARGERENFAHVTIHRLIGLSFPSFLPSFLILESYNQRILERLILEKEAAKAKAENPRPASDEEGASGSTKKKPVLTRITGTLKKLSPKETKKDAGK